MRSSFCRSLLEGTCGICCIPRGQVIVDANAGVSGNAVEAGCLQTLVFDWGGCLGVRILQPAYDAFKAWDYLCLGIAECEEATHFVYVQLTLSGLSVSRM